MLDACNRREQNYVVRLLLRGSNVRVPRSLLFTIRNLRQEILLALLSQRGTCTAKVPSYPIVPWEVQAGSQSPCSETSL